jgi:hypothetical protein
MKCQKSFINENSLSSECLLRFLYGRIWPITLTVIPKYMAKKQSLSIQLKHEYTCTSIYSTDRTQPNTRANPGFAFKNIAFALGSLWIRYGFAIWVRFTHSCVKRTPLLSCRHNAPPLYIPNIYTVAISVIIDFVLRYKNGERCYIIESPTIYST